MPLFDRVSNGLRLTQAGEELVDSADAVTRAGAEAEEVLRSAKGEPSGVLRVAASALSAQQFLGPVLARMRERHPRVEPLVRVTSMGPDPLAEDLDVVLRLGRPEEPYLIARRIMTATLRLYVSASVCQALDLTNPDAVEGLGRIVVEVPGSPSEWHLIGPNGEQIELSTQPMCRIGDPTVALGLLAAGTGVAFLPSLFGEPRVRSGEFRRALPDHEGPRAEIFASFPPRRASVPSVSAFLDILLEVGKEMPR